MNLNDLVKGENYQIEVMVSDSKTYEYVKKTYKAEYRGFHYWEDGEGIYVFWIEGDSRGREFLQDDIVKVVKL
jgi:hypothetical protein